MRHPNICRVPAPGLNKRGTLMGLNVNIYYPAIQENIDKKYLKKKLFRHIRLFTNINKTFRNYSFANKERMIIVGGFYTL